jgi:hypothetical protein
VRILISVVTCHSAKYDGEFESDHFDGPNHRAELIRETWKNLVPSEIDLKFFYGRGGVPKEDEIFLDVADEFHALTRKTQSVILYAFERGYDYLLQVTDDVFVNPALLNFDKDYSGSIAGHPQLPFKFISGFAWIISRRAMKILAETEVEWKDFSEFNIDEYRKITSEPDKVKWNDDLWIGRTLFEAGITPQNDPGFAVSIPQPKCDIPKCPCLKSYDLVGELSKLTAIHITPRFELMEELYERLR